MNVGLTFVGKGRESIGCSNGWVLIVIFSWMSMEEATSYFLFLQNKVASNLTITEEAVILLICGLYCSYSGHQQTTIIYCLIFPSGRRLEKGVSME